MQVFSTDTTILFCQPKVEKNTLKSCSEILNSFCIAAQTSQKEEFMFQNVAYRSTEYKTGAVGHPTFSNCVKSLLKIC